jgi:ATP-dependent protease ClpP protease subunit
MTNVNDKNTQDSTLYNLHQYNIDPYNREIFLHSHMEAEEEAGVDYRSAIMLEKNIRYLNNISNETILIHMHLPGGDWQDCLGMYDTIITSKARIIILAYAKAESCSGLLLQSAKLRILMPNTNLMIHYGSMSLDSEHSKAAASSIKWNEKECDKMVDIFTDKCMNSPICREKKWKKMIAKKHIMSQINNQCDWILTADEAIQYGFADGVLGSEDFPSIDYLKTYIKKMK